MLILVMRMLVDYTLLVEGANGTRIPVAVRGKRLGEMTQEELFSDNDFFNELHKAIRNVSEKSLELTEESLDGAVKTLRNIYSLEVKQGYLSGLEIMLMGL